MGTLRAAGVPFPEREYEETYIELGRLVSDHFLRSVMARIVEILVAVSALAGIASFLGFRALARKTAEDARPPGSGQKADRIHDRKESQWDVTIWSLARTMVFTGSCSTRSLPVVHRRLSTRPAKGEPPRYAAVPERNWAQGQPEVVERPPVVRWRMKGSDGGDQMTVDEVLAESDPEEAIEAAKEEMREALGMDEKEKEEVT